MNIYRNVFLLTVLSACPTVAATSPGAPAQIAPVSLPSVRGLEYHATILAQNTNALSRSPQKPINFWILPAHEKQPARGLGWDGVTYDLQRVGARADWRSDVKAALKPHVPGQPYYESQPFQFSPTPLSLVFLQELSAPDLLTSARLALKTNTWGRPNDALTTYHLNLRDAGVRSFSSGNWNQAKRQLQTLLAALPPTLPRNSYNSRSEATALLTDIERRLHPTPRPQGEIAALIYDLQNVRAFQMSSPGNIGWSQAPTVRKLIDKGDAAVEPLIDALEKDDRLTLSVRLNRGSFSRPGSIGTVREAALDALQLLLHHSYYGPNNWSLTPEQRNAAIVAQIRADWNASKGQNPAERVFKTLSTPGETPERLTEAAQQLVQIGASYNHNYIRLNDGTLRPDTPSQTFFGEPLRPRTNPSVSDLLEARIKELNTRALGGKQTPQAFNPAAPDVIGAPSSDPYALNKALRAANTLAWNYAKWDSKRAAPLLATQLEISKRYLATLPRGIAENGRDLTREARRQFLAARLKTPFRTDALREYGAYLQSVPFGRLPQDDYAPLWRFPAEPAIVRATHALFDAPRKPFQESAQWKTGDFGYDAAFRLLHSPLLKLPAFKAAVVRELSNKTIIGTLNLTKPREAEIKVSAWDWSGQTANVSRTRLDQGKSQPVRVCDLVGFWLYKDITLKDQPTRQESLLDVSLPTSGRDAQLPHIVSLVKSGRVVSEDFGFESFDF